MSEKVEWGEGYEFPKEVHNMLAGAQAAHVEFSAMADSKASILMGATFVVFSLTLGEMESNKISLPLLLLGAFSFAATAALAALAVPSAEATANARKSGLKENNVDYLDKGSKK